MKSTFKTEAKAFSPITVTITIETAEELKCFLDLTNSPSTVVTGLSLTSPYKVGMYNFINGLAPLPMFNELSEIYAQIALESTLD